MDEHDLAVVGDSLLDVAALQERVDAVLNEELYWFPVRHHSAAVARRLEAVIRQRRPKIVFIEGPAEAQDLIAYVVDAESRPPIAIYSSYRDDENLLGLAGIASPAADIPPRFSCYYPLLAYSPEYVAMQTAAAIQADVVFIDLPHYAGLKPYEKTTEASSPEKLIVSSQFYQHLATAAGFKSWDEAWDSLFEVRELDTEEFRRELATFCAAARLTTDAERIRVDGTLERERHFLKVIRKTLQERAARPAEAIVVCGGFHLFLDRDDPVPPPTPPPGTVYTTVMPYSFFRVSELSGYGAGNRAPQFYQTSWDLARAGRTDALVSEYAVDVLKRVRRDGGNASSADAIAIHQHAWMLAGLRGRGFPVLDDIQDAILTCCCKGNPNDEGLPLRRAIDHANIGTKVGKVTQKLGLLPIVSDFFAQLSDFDLGEVLNHERRVTLDLDKRQLLDERRSVLLHRLAFLDVPLAALTDSTTKDLATGQLFRERWALKWSPKIEPHLIEQTLLGESIEAAVLTKLSEQLALAGQNAGATCRNLREAIDMDLPNLVAEAQTGCGTAIDTDPRFTSLAEAVGHLVVLDQYAVYRNLRREELSDLIARGFDRACFALADVTSAPEDQFEAIVAGLQSLAELLLRGRRDEVDRAVFTENVRSAAEASTVPFLRGAFLGMLAELHEISGDDLAREVAAFALTTAERMVLAGEFLDGIMAVSRTSIMLGADSLVAAIDQLIRTAEWQVFLTMLPRLRGAFARLHCRQVDSLAGCVARTYRLSAEEQQQLTELNTSVGAAALIAEIDRHVAEIMEKWSF